MAAEWKIPKSNNWKVQYQEADANEVVGYYVAGFDARQGTVADHEWFFDAALPAPQPTYRFAQSGQYTTLNILTLPKTVGGYRMGDPPMSTTFNFTRKPAAWHRWWVRWTLGWVWVDE